ncbi:PTS sugar transporter subunit IIB [Collinsella sp. UBA1693]|jgi:fructoselysine and glucoselysine-specific PTS system IIB component|uniref:PTS sugar transporter subunit IIB n=1 Tax=Collinsella sp. UBA1693 TaxID=1946385 RepID=UPI00257C4735|nr:PTS sugar transporter subunit IIB [Collinsella sp. UBA1693]
MILNVRVDHRLLHGQVAFTWTTALGSDCILIANDSVVDDQIRKMTMKLAKPAGVKLVIKDVENSIAAINAGKTDKYKLFIVVETIADAARLARACEQVTAINIGGTPPRESTRCIAKAVYVTPEEEILIRELAAEGTEVGIRMVPVDKSIDALSALGEGGGAA